MYCLLFTFCFFMPVNTHKQTQEGSNQESMQSGNSMIKLENAGLRAPRKMSLGSGLHSQKRIRAPVSKMIGLRAPQQKFQGSRAPGTPPLGPCLILVFVNEKCCLCICFTELYFFYSRISHDVTKIQTKKLSILLSF